MNTRRKTRDDDKPKKSKFSGKQNHEVLAMKVDEEMTKTGTKPDDFKGRVEAGKRVMRAEPDLADAYHNDPNGEFEANEEDEDDDR